MKRLYESSLTVIGGEYASDLNSLMSKYIGSPMTPSVLTNIHSDLMGLIHGYMKKDIIAFETSCTIDVETVGNGVNIKIKPKYLGDLLNYMWKTPKE